MIAPYYRPSGVRAIVAHRKGIEAIDQCATSALLKRIQGEIVGNVDYSAPVETIFAEKTRPGCAPSGT